MTHKERNHIYFEEQCWFLTMSRASSFLGVFPSFRLRFAFPHGRGAQSGRRREAGTRPGPCRNPLGAAAPVRRLRANRSILAELSAAAQAAPGKGGGLCLG